MAFTCAGCGKIAEKPIELECGHIFHITCVWGPLVDGVCCPLCGDLERKTVAPQFRLKLLFSLFMAILCVIVYIRQ